MTPFIDTRLRDALTPFWPDCAAIGSHVAGRIALGSGELITIDDPATGAPLYAYHDAGEAVVAEAAAASVAAQGAWTRLTGAARGRVMQAIARAIQGKAEELARLESLSAGKPIRDTRVEVAKVAEMFEYYAGWADKFHGDVIPVPSSHLNYTRREPMGIVLQITPWNAPIFTCGWQVAPAIAMGNGVLLKPSELTPLTSMALAHLAEQAGLPVGLVNVLAGYGHTTGQAALGQPAVKKVVFVGSVPTGTADRGSGGQAAVAVRARARRQVCQHRVRRRRPCARGDRRAVGDLRRRRAELRRRLAAAGRALRL